MGRTDCSREMLRGAVPWLVVLAAALLLFSCGVFAQVTEISDTQYRELGKWLFGVEMVPTGKWGRSDCQYWGNLPDCRHTGVDYGANLGTLVQSATYGKVIRVAPGCTGSTDSCLSTLAIYHEETHTTFFYLHMETISVHKGDDVWPGKTVGTVGARGRGTGNHLHFEARPAESESKAPLLAALDYRKTKDPYAAAQQARITASVTPDKRSSTILVMDVSGSMAWSWKGGVKIDSAKKAAQQFIEQVANEPRPAGTIHEIGLVTFSGDAQLALPLTSGYAQARSAVIQLQTVTSTNIGSGLSAAIRELDRFPSAERFIILLSDGESNTGLSKNQILAGPVAEARAKGICIYTVAFGDPGDIDESFLKSVASGSGCGTYSYASTGFELFGTYIKIRHRMLGGQQIVDFTSLGKSVITVPGSPISLGAFKLLRQANELHYTLAWSEGGRMTAKLVDPSGQIVTAAYPGAKIYAGTQFAHVTILSPQPGIWRVSGVPQQQFPANIQYYGVVSSRPGGVIPFNLPLLCVRDWCVPWPDLPTVLIVAISLAALALLLYEQLAQL